MTEKGIINVPVMQVHESSNHKTINSNDLQPPIIFYNQDNDDEHLRSKNKRINQRNKMLYNKQTNKRRLSAKDIYNDELNPMADFNRQLNSLHQSSELIYGKVKN